MTGSVIDKTVIRREAEHINRIYPETAYASGSWVRHRMTS